MKNDLIKDMFERMKIPRFRDENANDYMYRVLYSALAFWTLRIAEDRINLNKVCSKNHMSSRLGSVLERFLVVLPECTEYFNVGSSPSLEVSKYFMEAYLDTGYLLSSENYYIELAKYGRTVNMDGMVLFYGLTKNIAMNGLGVFANEHYNERSIEEIMFSNGIDAGIFAKNVFGEFRDRMTNRIKEDDYDFFNPCVRAKLSESWQRGLAVDYSIARKKVYNNYEFYLCRRVDGEILSCACPDTLCETVGMFGFELRRIMYGLKFINDNAGVAQIETGLDCFVLKLNSKLPNKEKLMLMLLGWPLNKYDNETMYLFSNIFKNSVTQLINNLNIRIENNELHRN